MAISPCKNLCGKVDQLDKLEDELGQLSQVGHAKNHSALSALFALLQVKVQKVQIVQCKKITNQKKDQAVSELDPWNRGMSRCNLDGMDIHQIGIVPQND